jgi:hypothetical protein
MLVPADKPSTLYLVCTLGFSVQQKSYRKELILFSYDGQSTFCDIIKLFRPIMKMFHPRFRASCWKNELWKIFFFGCQVDDDEEYIYKF